MNYPGYSFRQSADATQFFFESVGSKGIVQKVVAITKIEVENVYNLALGDYNPVTDQINDRSVTDNQDTAKILATIYQIVHIYLTTNPHHLLIFAGHTPSRNRLYRMAINQGYQELSHSFSLLGYRQEEWEPFESNQEYELFLIGKK